MIRTREISYQLVDNVGGQRLKAGMYRVYSEFVNCEYFVAFREVIMNNGKSMAPLTPDDEVARSKCTEGSVDKKIGKAKILVRRNSADERIPLEVWFRGDKVKHILPGY